MISPQKRITVHGPGTHHNLTAFALHGYGDPVLAKAGFGTDAQDPPFLYVAIIRWGPTSHLYVDHIGGYARAATGTDDFVLNGAVQEILNNFNGLPENCHIEVAREGDVAVSEGLRFK